MSSEAKHTPGKWLPNPKLTTVYAFGGPVICEVRWREMSEGEVSANLALIAAAPALLDELRQTAAWLDERAAVLTGFANDTQGWGNGSKATARRQAIRDEVARYRGRAMLIRQTIDKATTTTHGATT